MENKSKTKIDKGYWQDGYARGYRKNVVIWLINGKLYAKDAYHTPYSTDLPGYIMINKINKISPNGSDYYYAIGLISQHQKYRKS